MKPMNDLEFCCQESMMFSWLKMLGRLKQVSSVQPDAKETGMEISTLLLKKTQGKCLISKAKCS